MAKLHPVSVRTLAEFSLQTGDLIPSSRIAERMSEGRAGHRIIQSLLPDDWLVEAPIERETLVDGVTLTVQGRADAMRVSDNLVEIIEIKTVQGDPGSLSGHEHPEHRAQAEIYAYLFCEERGIDSAEVTVLYYHLDGREKRIRRAYDIEKLRERFLRCAAPYAAWVSVQEAWKETSVPTLQSMKFPFPNYRDGQKEMAKAVYAAMRPGGKALIEAPTGIGKTAAALFGALKALGKGRITAIFYLTARTTGRKSAAQALAIMREKGLRIRSIEITAKEKCCMIGTRECYGCPYAVDYYARRGLAVQDAMSTEMLDADAIHALAQEYQLCPYELSLDLSEQADVIICDYNYAFDPRVRLRRYFDKKTKAALLIDEAHNLPDRARDMLSVTISCHHIETLLTETVRTEGVESPMAVSLASLLAAFRKEDAEFDSLTEIPKEYVDAARRFGDEAMEIGPSERTLVDLMLDTQWFAKRAETFDEKVDRLLIQPEDGERNVSVKLWCFDPSEHLKTAFARVGGAALFSGTLAPMNFYASQSGLAPDDAQLQLESPFPPENCFAARLPVSVKLADRERTAGAVTAIIRAVMQAKTGNYVVCFPSFAYLDLIYTRYRYAYPDDRVICQRSGMDEAAREAFIKQFSPHPKRSMAAMIVLGGVFAEGVDLPDDRLSGAVILSTGMPQLNFEAGQLTELFDDGFGAGYDVAYTYPGIRRVLQAAGRVIRTETDRGVVLLLDTRYADEHIRELLPVHWKVRKVKKLDELKNALNRFWKEDRNVKKEGT